MKVLSILFFVAFVVLCSAQMMSAPPAQVSTDDQNQNDYKTLQYALTLEHLEAAFYAQGLARFTEADFNSANLPANTRNYINLIRAHEDAHVNLLTTVLETNGVPAVRACTYDFSQALSSIQNFLTTAQVLEVTGTQAYDGAANTINNAVYLEVAATIATVEARHSAYLNQLNNDTAFPDSFEQALTPEQVIPIAATFIVSCPDGDIEAPVFAYNFVTLEPNATYFNRSGQLEDSEQINNDDNLLNYALTLELFGGEFYNRASQYTRTQFQDAGFGAVYDYFQMIIEHERAHVAFLQDTLASRGVAAVQPCTYNYGDALNSVANALNFARTLENLEVSAYDGAINRITDYQLIQGAATIATVEARHAQYLNNVLLGVAVNNESLDTALNPFAILNITAPFFGADCTAPAVPSLAYTLQFLTRQAAAATTAPTPSPSTAAATPSASPMMMTPTPAPSTVATPSPSPMMMTPTPAPSATVCPTPTPTPTGCSATPSPCGCNGNNGGDDGDVIINFYFADMLRGLNA